MSPDPYDGSMDPSNPQSLNRYSYVLNNPLSMVDPSGLDACVYDNGDGTVTIYNAADGGGIDCPGNGSYITTSQQVTGAGFDANGDLNVYGADGNLYASDGSPYDVPQSVTVNANGNASFSDLPFIYSPSTQYIVSDPDIQRIGMLAMGVASNTKSIACAQEAIGENGKSLALDAAGFIPGESQVTATVQLGVGAASFVNSLVENDAFGAVLSVKGAQATVADMAFRSIGEETPKLIPFVGYGLNAIGTLRDLGKARDAYNKCMSQP